MITTQGHHQDADLNGLLYGFVFRPGQPGREIDSTEARALLLDAISLYSASLLRCSTMSLP